MSADWPIRTLGDVCQKITDGAHNSPKSVDIGKPMVSVKDLTPFGVDLSEARLISIEDFDKLVKQGCKPEVGDVLIAKDGNSALDTVCRIKKPLDAVLLSSVAILRPDLEKLDADFLKYYFSSKVVIEYLKINFISGAAIPRVVLQNFRKAEIKSPPLCIQKTISSILNSLDNKIELNQQINQTLESMAKAIFKSWFVDFDPVKAKITALEAGEDAEGVTRAAMRAISGKTDDELDKMEGGQPEDYAQLKTTAELFPAAMQDSELGGVPEGWNAGTVKNIVTRLTPKKRYTKRQVMPYGRVPVLEQGADIILGYHDDEAGFTASPDKSIFIFGDHTCITYLSCQPFDISQNVIPLEGNKLPTMWVYYAVKDLQSFQEYRRHWSEFSIKPVIVPDKVLSDVFSKLATSFYTNKENNIDQSSKLSQLRDTLLPKLLSGELSVDTVEFVEDEA